MRPESKAFLYKLLETPSPTGAEQQIQRVVRDHMKPYAETIETDLHGNVIVGINTKAKRKVMLAGHCDQIGFMVRHISKEGFIFVMAVGGIDVGVLPGSFATVYGEKGAVVGVFGRKPIHSQSAEERDRFKLDMEKVWIDIGAKDDKDVKKKGIAVGDYATFKLGVTELGSDLIVAAGLDDRVGLFVAMEALRLCTETVKGRAAKPLNVALYSVSTVQEEVGLRGARTSAFSVDPMVGIAIDVGHSTDNPGSDNPKAVPFKLGAGPGISRGCNTNTVVEARLKEAAKKSKIPVQILPDPRPFGNDANAMQISRGGVAAASLAIPNRYMHTQVEVCSLADLEQAARLLATFVRAIDDKTDFRPM